MAFAPQQLLSDIDAHLAAMAGVEHVLGRSLHPAPDHIGYRCDSTESYESKYNDLDHTEDLLRQVVVAERRIAVFRLRQAVRGLALFALQEPRPDETRWEGLEHLGYVVADLEVFRQALQACEEIKTMPTKQVGAGRYFKFYFEGIEIELRDRPIELG